MVQPVDAASPAAVQIGMQDAPRQIPTAQGEGAAADAPALSEEHAAAKVVEMFMTQVMMMMYQETEKIRKHAEKMVNELREEE